MFSLLLVLGVKANQVVYSSSSGTIDTDVQGGVIFGGGAYVDFPSRVVVELGEGEAFQPLSVAAKFTINIESNGAVQNQTKDITLFRLQIQRGANAPITFWSPEFNAAGIADINSTMVVGPCKILVSAYVEELATSAVGLTDPKLDYDISFKVINTAEANTTTSAPILLPPTPNAAASWFVKLQMSSDLKTWEDVQAGQFLGSDAARFFRIQTTAAE